MPIDLAKHKEAFLSEARTHVAAMNAALLKLENVPSNEKALHEVFWATHTLKSLAGAMNYIWIEKLCHAMEDVLDGVRKRGMPVRICANLLFECFDQLESALKRLSKNEEELETTLWIEKVKAFLTRAGSASPGPSPDASNGTGLQRRGTAGSALLLFAWSLIAGRRGCIGSSDRLRVSERLPVACYLRHSAGGQGLPVKKSPESR